MIISGLRTSCAITVDRRPSDDSRSRCAASRWKRAIDSVSVLNVGAEQPRVLVVPGAALDGDLARQVAGGGHVAHRVGDGGQRPGHRAGDGVAEDRGQEQRDDEGAGEAGAERVQEAQALGARAQDERGRGRWRSAAAPARANGRATITYSSPCSDTGLTPRPSSARRGLRAAGGSDDARTRPPAANAISVPVTALNCAARRSSRKNPTVSRPIVSVGSSPSQDRHADDLQQPAGVGHRSVTLVDRRAAPPPPAAARRLGAGRAPAAAPCGRRSTSASASICARYSSASGCDGRRVAGRDRRLELGQVGDEPRERRERVGEGGAALVDERAGLRQVAAQLGLGLAGGLGVDESEGKAERHRRQQRAGQEDPVGERRRQAHRSRPRLCPTEPRAGSGCGRPDAQNGTPAANPGSASVGPQGGERLRLQGILPADRQPQAPRR